MLDADSVFDEVHVEIETASSPLIAVAMIAYNSAGASGAARNVHRARPTSRRLGTYDLDDVSLREMARRVEEGTATLRYRYDSDWFDDPPPAGLATLFRSQNPLNQFRVTLRQVANAGPYSEMWYRRSATVITAAPDVGALDGLAETAASIMEAAGWTRAIPTGTDTLYYTEVTWGIQAEAAYAQATPPRTDDIRWRIEGSDTFTATPPAADAVVEEVELYVPGYGWDAFYTRPIDPESPVAWMTADAWQNYTLDSTQTPLELTGASAEDLIAGSYAIGVRGNKSASWADTGTLDYEGAAELPTDILRWVYPHQYAARDAQHRVPGKTYLMTQSKHSGAVTLSLMAPTETVNDWAADHYAACTLVFVAFPRTELTGPHQAGSPNIAVASDAGLQVGDTLFIGAEQLRVTGLPGTTPPDFGGRWVDVERGVNGTTAGSAAAGAVVRAVVNADKLRQAVITNRSTGMSHLTRLRFYRKRVL